MDPPVQDGIGITDAVVEALAALPLETLLLGGSESLTDAIGKDLARLATLRALDLSNLPKTTGALLREVPKALTSLGLDHNPQWPPAAFATLPALPDLREFGLAGLPQLDDDTLGTLLAEKKLSLLRLGGENPRSKAQRQDSKVAITGAAAVHVARQRGLVELDLRFETWLDRAAMAQIATLPALRVLDLTGPLVNPLRTAQDLLPELQANRSIEVLRLRWRVVPKEQLGQLADLPLRELEVAGTNLTADEVRALAPAWPGCTITMLHGQRFKVP